MPFTPKDWHDKPVLDTPITAFELERIEAAIQAAQALAESHPATTISDSTTVGRSVLTALTAAAARAAIGAGTGNSNLVLGTTAGTAKAGDYQPASTNISDSTSVGRGVLTAATAAAIRALLGLPVLAPVVANRQTLPAANTYVAGLSIPAGLLVVGSHFRAFLEFSNPATASNTTLTVKYGTAGTTADATIHTNTFTGTANADAAIVIVDIHVDSINSGTGQITSQSSIVGRNLGGSAAGFHNVAAGSGSTNTQTGSLDTTAARTLGIAIQETAATTVLLHATLEQIK